MKIREWLRWFFSFPIMLVSGVAEIIERRIESVRVSQDYAEKELWIVGQVNPENYLEWEIQGVFDSESTAIAACLTCHYFVGKVRINRLYPHKTTGWEGAYYPQQEGSLL